ncbi:hypothetical protein J2S74_004684 [Evansella vedderi]|uniref:Uncharacterized protein n=1 Tax=Evansella vedderi TaxID=38282 RepID=A0ABU0A161_9BACI|nr:hypothetical protein [Evansella vedderi]MDQ0257226.1 hypothetical protein [Evansella vedderi]
MKKKLLLSVLSTMFALGFLAACADVEDEPFEEDPMGEEGDPGLD